jgi:hypothetical protein
MNKQFEFKDQNGEFYSLKISKNEIKLDAYMLAENPTGLANTECYHELKGNDIPAFLNRLGVENVEELVSLLPDFNDDQWSNLHKKITESQSESFIWQETNWNE